MKSISYKLLVAAIMVAGAMETQIQAMLGVTKKEIEQRLGRADSTHETFKNRRDELVTLLKEKANAVAQTSAGDVLKEAGAATKKKIVGKVSFAEELKKNIDDAINLWIDAAKKLQTACITPKLTTGARGLLNAGDDLNKLSEKDKKAAKKLCSSFAEKGSAAEKALADVEVQQEEIYGPEEYLGELATGEFVEY